MEDTQSHPDRTENRILDAARDLFTRYGYDKTTLDDIARRAKVARSTLYLRWKKKDDLFGTLLWREARWYLDRLSERITHDPESGTFHSFFKNAILVMKDSPFLLALYSKNRQVMGAYLQRPEMRGAYHDRLNLTVNLLKTLQSAGTVRKDIQAETAAYLLNSLNYGLIKIGEVIPPELEPPVEALVEMTAEMLEGLFTPEDGGDLEAGKQVIFAFIEAAQTTINQYDNP